MSMKTVIQNFAKEFKVSMHTYESFFDLLSRYLPKFEESAGVNYSTDEHIVGKYNDKDVYEKTFEFKTGNSLTTEVNLNTSPTSILSLSGTLVRNSVYYPINSSDSVGNVNANVNISTKKIYVYITENAFMSKDCQITIRYLK